MGRREISMTLSRCLQTCSCRMKDALLAVTMGRIWTTLKSLLFPPSELPAYTASPDDAMRGARALTKREKREKLEKKEESDRTDRDAAKVELFSGEEGVSSRSSVGSPSVVRRAACPYANFDTDRSDSWGDTVPIEAKWVRRTPREVNRENGEKDQTRNGGRKLRGEKKRGRSQRHGRSGGGGGLLGREREERN